MSKAITARGLIGPCSSSGSINSLPALALIKGLVPAWLKKKTSEQNGYYYYYCYYRYYCYYDIGCDIHVLHLSSESWSDLEKCICDKTGHSDIIATLNSENKL